MATTTLSRSVACIWLFANLVSTSFAQTNKLFQWQFDNNLLSSSLPTCSPLPIIVKSFNTTTNATSGTPPYYMLSFALDSTPYTTLIGRDNSSLSWTVTHPVGTRLVLSVVDANGSAGGVSPKIFTVIAGQTTNCVTNPQTTPAFQITANVTGDLVTCQPWGISVKGGAPPYTITFLQPSSPVVTNASMGFGDDRFTYINRADPNNQLIAAVSDLTGRWANGTAMVNAIGSSDVACTGLVSSSGNSTVIDQRMKAAKAAEAAKAKKKQRIILGVTIPLALLLVAALGGLGFLLYRRRQKMKQEEVEIFLDNAELQTDGPITPVSYYSHSVPPIPSKKRSEINQHPNSFISSPGGTSAEPGSPERLSHSGVVPASGGSGEELVIQHMDASEVKELPPPYKDNRADGPSGV